MRSLTLVFLVLGLRFSLVGSAAVQVPLQVHQSARPKPLRGRFLHITDIHPDPYYRVGADEERACHRKHPSNKEKNNSGYYGTPYSECDSPFKLTNFTLNYIADNWADEIDFVIWSGDNARHDNDRHQPRTTHEIYDLNKAVAAKMREIFVHRGVPVVPSLGNNDVWPHNILTPGPNSITHEYASIWKQFIPFPYLQVFQRGAYYAVEVIPDQLAVISLNTMYFYDSNKVVSGCAFSEPEDPGNLQLDWLDVQLQEYLERDMLVYITGHVPPSPGNYFPECFVRYAELALRFQNIILGHLFGHMNADHFFFLEAIDLQIVPDKDEDENKYRTAGDDRALYDTLIQEFAAIPVPKKINFDDYAVVNVAPAVVPNPYVPSFRIFTYNVGDRRGTDEAKKKKKPKRNHGHKRGDGGNKTVHCQKEDYQNSWKCHLDEPWNSDPESPPRKNQFLTPLGYAQYNIPNLEEANKTHAPGFELEYVTFPVDKLHPEEEGFPYPIPVRHLPEELRNGSTTKSVYAPYGMEDLTIPSWVRLARKIADDKRIKLRKKFKKYMFGGRR